MEFIKLKRFEYKQPLSKIQSGVQPRSDFKFSDKIKITCFRFCSADQTISIGLNNGLVAVFCNPRFNQKKLTQTKDFQLRTFTHITNPHKGQIRCLIYEKIFQQWYIITGSSDRTIKIWDTDPKTKDVTQTIVGHNGTVLALAYSKGNDTLFSASNDKTVRIWKQQKHREFFQHPWYICYQVISEFTSKRIEHPLYVTSFELRDGEKDKFILFMGDSEGSLHQVRLKEIVDKDSKKKDTRQVFVLEKSNFNYHRLSIHKLLCVHKENILFSLSYDQTAMGYEEMTEKQFLKMPNTRKQIFTSCAWLDGLLVLGDQGGCLYFVEINTEKEVEELQKYDCRILGMQYIREVDELLIATEGYIDSVKIKRGVKSGEGNSHTDAVIGVFALEPYKITNKKVKDSPKLITVSLDNTMRIWDPQDLTCLSVLQNPQKGQISCLSYLQHANLFVTGHQNGAVRLWNIQLGNSITIDQTQSPFKHSNSICALASYIYERGNEDITEYLFSAGYEGKINVWEIFEKKNIVQSSLMSSTICPQLKYSFFADATQKIADRIGNEILSMCIYQEGTKVEPESDRYIISAGNSGKIYFTKMFTYEHQDSIYAHEDSIYSLIIDENILFSGSLDKTIKLWSLEDKSLLTFIDGSESGVRSLHIIEETGHLVNNAFSGEVFFWDYPRKTLVKKIDQKNQRIQAITYINQFKTLFVGTQQANIYTYSISDLYQNKAILPAEHKHFHIQQVTEVNEKMIEDMLKRNQQELEKHNKS